jgi:hypothetical protein
MDRDKESVYNFCDANEEKSKDLNGKELRESKYSWRGWKIC